MDDEDEKIPTVEKGDNPVGRRSDSASPMEEIGGVAGGSAVPEDAPTASTSQERLNISPNESRNSQKSLFCASSSGGASTPSDAGSVGRPGSGSGGETIVIGSSSASSSQSSASTTPTASTPGCTRGTTPTPPITKQPQQRGASPSGTTTPTSQTATTAVTPNAPASSNTTTNNAATEAAAQEQALLEAARRIEELQAMKEPPFPIQELGKLDDMINRPRWIVPVLPKGELEVLLNAAIELCKAGVDSRSEPCQRFFREGLTISFNKILTDDAVHGWKFEIHRCIQRNTEKLVELCVAKLHDDWFPLLELLAIALNPQSKFHQFNGSRTSETVPPKHNLNEDELFARPLDLRSPRGWLVDLINLFGNRGGFQILLERFTGGGTTRLSVPVISALIRPFGLCFELLTPNTVVKYFMPIVELVPTFLDNLTDDELKKEAKNESKNDSVSSIVKYLKNLVTRLPNQEEKIKSLEMFRLKMILRLLQISSFNGKMNALNEINKVITGVSYYAHRHSSVDDDEWLTADRMAEWLQENQVLSIVLRDSLHQPQYVEKLEKILRFVIKEKALTIADLDALWAAQNGKHEAIVKNVHDLLAKLAWDFASEQLDHLFLLFQSSWEVESTKQREALLELIRRLAEDDKDGIMAHKVLGLLWSLAHSDDAPTELMDQALHAHVKILDYSCSQDRDNQKMTWITKFVDELRNDKWVIPALKQIKEICTLFPEAPQNYANSVQRSPHVSYRHEVIAQLQNTHSLVTLVAENLTTYMNRARHHQVDNPDASPEEVLPDGRYCHVQQVQERLNFLRFLLKDGQLWLCAPQAKQIWTCICINAIYPSDREACFKWFSKLMGDEPDLDPEINRDFFTNNILQLDPVYLTESGIKCFERFFKAVNTKEQKLIQKRRCHMMDDLELIGLDYVWRVVISSQEEVAEKAISLLKEIYTNLGPRLQPNQVDIHEDFVASCMDRLKACYDTVTILTKDKDIEKSKEYITQETVSIVRVLTVLFEYVSECDDDYHEERAILPLGRACRGKHLSLIVRFPNQGRQFDDIELWSHANETVGSVRRQILNRLKANATHVKVELFVNGDAVDVVDDKKLISQVLADVLNNGPNSNKALITAKLSQAGSNMPSSPDSSSDSSTTGSPRNTYDGPNAEAEKCLPGVIMSGNPRYASFLFQLADLGSQLQLPKVREGASTLLKLMPADLKTVESLKDACVEPYTAVDSAAPAQMEALFFCNSPSQALYHLEVTYLLLMPALNPMSEEAFEFQRAFMRSGGVSAVLSMLTRNNYLISADLITRQQAYLIILKIAKILLTSVGHAMVQVVAEACSAAENAQQSAPAAIAVSPSQHSRAVILQQALHQIPSPSSEMMLKSVVSRLGQALSNSVTSVLPDIAAVKAVVKLAWVSASGSLQLLQASNDDIHKTYENLPTDGMTSSWASNASSGGADPTDINLAKEALEVLTICLALCPDILDQLTSKGDKSWQCFIVDLILLCPSRTVRAAASEQLYLIATKCGAEKRPLLFFITLLFTVLDTTARENARQSHEYFQILCRLLNYACQSKVSVPTNFNQLNKEVEWLSRVRNSVVQTGLTGVEEALLEGHLGVTKELLAFQTSEVKQKIGSDHDGHQLIKQLVDDFIFPASKIVLQCRKSDGDLPDDHAIPVCSTPLTITAAFDLLVSLCTGCVPNLRLLAEMLTDMYFNGTQAVLQEWEFLPPVGPRPHNGFVGLKNAGATCYMNSVLQQLFMIDEIREGILKVEGAVHDTDEDISGDEREDKEEGEDKDECRADRNGSEERKEYNTGVLKHVQMIFGHLATSKLQFYVPKGFWRHFKLWGEPVNLREQHDALEFFNSLVDSLDEALKLVKQPPILSKIMGGSFADQKICKGCPHRYSREESFTTLNVDIRNHHDLLSSMEQYVKGDLLEGANAYHCEKCDKKVDTVKRLCIKKLPPYLAIQLKRFDYDWEHETAIKFNDYFEFPKELDMEPYTEKGLAASSVGEWIHDSETFSMDVGSQSTKYRLVGVVVHSGQASGGHYYSYILHRPAEGSISFDGKISDGEAKWFKFDDGEVTESKFDEEEEMKNQWFGGEYMGEVFDHMLKRMSYRRQKRWWNAYILFYEQLPAEEEIDLCGTPAAMALADAFKSMNLAESATSMTSSVVQPPHHPKMPPPIERCVRRKNIQFMHNKTLFSLEFFQFMKKLIACNGPFIQQNTNQQSTTEQAPCDSEELAMISIQLASKFLFSIGFHTKKTLRGSATEWYDALRIHLQCSRAVRAWFAHNVLFAHQERFAEYMLECPTSEVRSAFVKIIWFLAHYSLQDGPCSPPTDAPELLGLELPNATLSDYILSAVLALLKKEVAEHGRTLSQYFHFFYIYANLGVTEKMQLLKLGVPVMFMLVALDEGPGPPIKYQYAELGKLYSVVSLLVRCCDVSGVMQNSQPPAAALPNPHGDTTLSAPLMPIQSQVNEILFRRNTYVKKVIEDCNASEETVKLLRFCCWENPHFSSSVLSELLWQVAYSYTYELRPYMDLLYQMLLIEDSWQQHRIHNALKGIPDDRDGLFDTIQKSKNHYQKRAYQCIKMMVNLFSNCPPASNMLHSQGDLKRKWTWAVEWLNDELERRPYTGNVQYTNNWNPPVQSNETSNGYYLERSQSARMTLARAFELCADEDAEAGVADSNVPGNARNSHESGELVGSDNEVEGGASGGAIGSSQQAQQETMIPSPAVITNVRGSDSSMTEQRNSGSEQMGNVPMGGPHHPQKHPHSPSPGHQSSSSNMVD